MKNVILASATMIAASCLIASTTTDASHEPIMSESTVAAPDVTASTDADLTFERDTVTILDPIVEPDVPELLPEPEITIDDEGATCTFDGIDTDCVMPEYEPNHDEHLGYDHALDRCDILFDGIEYNDCLYYVDLIFDANLFE